MKFLFAYFILSLGTVGFNYCCSKVNERWDNSNKKHMQ